MVKTLTYFSMLSLLALGGCGYFHTDSLDFDKLAANPKQIIERVLDSSNTFESYYSKGVTNYFEGDELMISFTIEEYRSHDGKSKAITYSGDGTETISLNDGESILLFESDAKTAYQMDFPESEEHHLMTPREQIISLINALEPSPQYEIVGEEVLLGIDTFHMKVQASSEKSLIHQLEFWIDPKSWMILKAEVIMGDSRSESYLTKLELSPDFDEDTFLLPLPEEITIEPFTQTVSGNVTEAETAFGQPFYLFSDGEFTLEHIEIGQLMGDLEQTSVDLYYMKDGVPSFYLSIYPVHSDIGDGLTKHEQTIRGQTVSYYQFDTFELISWDENGLRYTVTLDNPRISVEELILAAENMQLSSDN